MTNTRTDDTIDPARAWERGAGDEAMSTHVMTDGAGNAIFVGQAVLGSPADPGTDGRVIGFGENPAVTAAPRRKRKGA